MTAKGRRMAQTAASGELCRRVGERAAGILADPYATAALVAAVREAVDLQHRYGL